MGIKVRAKARGYYGLQIREKGDEFLVEDEESIGKWMERVTGSKAAAKAAPEPEKPKKGRAAEESKI